MRSFLLVLLLGVSAAGLAAKDKPQATYTIPMPPQPDFSALDWLVGEWSGKTTGREPQGEVRLSVRHLTDLNKRFLIFREEVKLPPTKQSPGVDESWMGVLSADRSQPGFVLRTFSSTGFMARYRVIVQGNEIRFNPEGGDDPPPGWLFRRVITRVGNSGLALTVQAAPPDKPFFDYYTAELTREPSK
ncbi:MAG: hypothetical protein HYS33_03400 [Acidobacteria bacterium]|nr:hypothetical protein [Acidobacteriota bacterium]